MSEQEEHNILLKQASIKRVAVPLFLITAVIYLLVAINQFLFVSEADPVFIFFGTMYGIFAFVYICHSTSESIQKILVIRKKTDQS